MKSSRSIALSGLCEPSRCVQANASPFVDMHTAIVDRPRPTCARAGMLAAENSHADGRHSYRLRCALRKNLSAEACFERAAEAILQFRPIEWWTLVMTRWRRQIEYNRRRLW